MSDELHNNKEFYIGTEIATEAQLDSVDIHKFDRIYLGNPYCKDFEHNILINDKTLAAAIDKVNSSGVIPIVSLIAMPNNTELVQLDRIIETSLKAGVRGFEAHSLGVLYHLSKLQEVNNYLIVAGGFSNVYTARTASLFSKMSVGLIVPNYELPIDAIDSINSSLNISLELLIHGKIPLGLSESCLLVERSEDLGTKCPESCKQSIWLEFDRWTLRSLGKLTCSGKDLCLYQQLELLWGKGFRNFRISGLCEEGSALNTIGTIYREKIQNINERKDTRANSMKELAALSKYGFCNGYIFGKSGCEWIE